MRKILGLDLSTASTGWAYFEDKSLNGYGALTPEVKGLAKIAYPKGSLLKCVSLAEQISNMVLAFNPDYLVIEEINKGTARISQKTLDGLHFIVLLYLLNIDFPFNKIYFIDSDGATGWRSSSKLNLKLSEKDKSFNKMVKAENKKLIKFNRGVPAKNKIKPQKEINKKTLACNMANNLFKLDLDIVASKRDEDISDAILLTWAFIKFEIGL